MFKGQLDLAGPKGSSNVENRSDLDKKVISDPKHFEREIETQAEDPQQAGKEEAVKISTIKEERSKVGIEVLAETSQNKLYKLTTIWPFKLFPTDVIIDPNKVDIIYRYFFFSEQIHSIYITDITDVLIEKGLFFATLKIVDRGFIQNSIDIPYLGTNEAEKAREIIQGLVIAKKEDLDLSVLNDTPDATQKVQEIGKLRLAY